MKITKLIINTRIECIRKNKKEKKKIPTIKISQKIDNVQRLGVKMLDYIVKLVSVQTVILHIGTD